MQHSRYVVVAGAVVTQFTIIGFLFAYGIFLPEFERELGWSRTLLSAAASVSYIMMGLLAIVGGRLNDRFGPKLVLGTTGVLYGVGIVLLSRATEPWQLILLWATLLAAGLATHDVVTLSTTARWFDRRRGIMSAVVKVGTAVGQVVWPPVTAALIAWIGWRSGMATLGVAAGMLLILGAFLMRLPSAAERPTTMPATDEGASPAEARHSRTFWTICAMQLLFFTTLMTVPLHLAVHGMDQAMSKETAAYLLSTMGASSVIGRLGIGFLFDRIGGRNAYTVALAALTASLGLFIFVTDHAALFATTALYGFGHGALFVVVSPTVAQYFGMRAHGALFGTVLFFGTIGSAIGPIATGWVFDTFGSYAPAFTALALAAAVALVLARSLPKTGV